jgi:MoxR-like ATPase
VATIKILVGVVQKNVVVIDADGLAKTRFVAHLAAYALRIGARRKYQGGGQS